MSERYKPGTRIKFPLECDIEHEQLVHTIIPNCKMPGDVCIEFDGRVLSYDEEFLDKNAEIVAEADQEKEEKSDDEKWIDRCMEIPEDKIEGMSGDLVKHYAHCFLRIKNAVDSMGGMANFSSWMNNHALSYLKTCKNLEKDNQALIELVNEMAPFVKIVRNETPSEFQRNGLNELLEKAEKWKGK